MSLFCSKSSNNFSFHVRKFTERFHTSLHIATHHHLPLLHLSLLSYPKLNCPWCFLKLNHQSCSCLANIPTSKTLFSKRVFGTSFRSLFKSHSLRPSWVPTLAFLMLLTFFWIAYTTLCLSYILPSVLFIVYICNTAIQTLWENVFCFEYFVFCNMYLFRKYIHFTHWPGTCPQKSTGQAA